MCVRVRVRVRVCVFSEVGLHRHLSFITGWQEECSKQAVTQAASGPALGVMMAAAKLRVALC